jgi:hypothetical protein
LGRFAVAPIQQFLEGGNPSRTSVCYAVASDTRENCQFLNGLAGVFLGQGLDVARNLIGNARLATAATVLGNLACQRFGLNRNAKYRALRSLENAGLVDVERKLGRSPVVTILDGAGAL